MKSKKYDFSKMKPENTMPIEQVRTIMEQSLLVKKENRLGIKTTSFLEVFIKNRDLECFFKNVLFYTGFLKCSASMKERLFCLWNSIDKYPECETCGRAADRFCGNFTNGKYGKFCSAKCNGIKNNPYKNMSTQELKLMRDKIKKTRKERYSKFPEWWKENLKRSASSTEVKNKKRKTCLERYGVENPGVLGAYHSGEACEYISEYIRKNNIDPDRCYYYDKENGKNEFWRMIMFEGKQRYFSYDLIVFKNPESARLKEVDGIQTVLEYNGPWHYSAKDVVGHENEKAMPYRSCKKTKLDVYRMDKVKIDYMINLGVEVLIYWSTKKCINSSQDDFDLDL